MTSEVLAAVNLGSQTELRTFPRPRLPEDAALLRVEGAGICGSDISAYAGGRRRNYIMGHENVGTIDEIGAAARRRWGLEVGDRVLLEEYLPCWHCEWCHAGQYRLCFATDHRQNPDSIRFGRTEIDKDPGLWGGFSQYLFVPHNSVIHRVATHVPTHHAPLALPIANGIQWAVKDGGTGAGSSILIMGPGQQGLGCVIAALASGATEVIVAGLGADRPRLDAAIELGAHAAVDIDSEDLEETVLSVTNGRGVDTVVDTTSAPGAGNAATALRLMKRKGGTVLLPGSGQATIPDFPLAMMASKYATLKVTRGHSYKAVEEAIRIIESARFNLDLVATNELGLAEVDAALRMGAQDRSTIHVTINPWKA